MAATNLPWMVLLAVLSVVTWEVTCLTCYHCSYNDDCKDPFDRRTVATCTDGDTCYKLHTVIQDTPVATRGCLYARKTENKCHDQYSAGRLTRSCYCSGNLCNAAPAAASSSSWGALVTATLGTVARFLRGHA